MAILNGWKQIASHMGQGVRTVQRWEVIGLPIHRPRGMSRSAVIAFEEELDLWSHAAPILRVDEIKRLEDEIVTLKAEVEALKRQLASLVHSPKAARSGK